MQTQTTLFKTSFSRNWNKKLNCDYFTTIRLPSAKFRHGLEHQIINNNEYCFNARICLVTEKYLHQLTEIECYQDTGCNKTETCNTLKKLYPNYDFSTKPILIILFKQL